MGKHLALEPDGEAGSLGRLPFATLSPANSGMEDDLARLGCQPRRLLLSWLLPLLLCDILVAQIGTESDVAIEQCLLSASVVKKTGNLKGATRPVRMKVECDGQTRSAVFKTMDVFRRGRTEMQDGTWEMNFGDSYRFERAAYLVDRELGLNMVPVAVIREVKRTDGALIDWITDATHENDPERPLSPAEVAALAPQKAIMHLFDALIYNFDRNVKNWMVEGDRLYLIDHSRSFRELGELPESYLKRRAWLTRDLAGKLKALDEERLTLLLEDLVTRGQIRALLSRRDQILEKIARDGEEYGETVVFHE